MLLLLLATCFADIARKKLQRRDVPSGGEGKANKHHHGDYPGTKDLNDVCSSFASVLQYNKSHNMVMSHSNRYRTTEGGSCSTREWTIIPLP